jgi:hypothetical protein
MAMTQANPLLTTFEFVLPRGLVDEQGGVHTEGTMRLATARDEMMADKDPRGQDSSTYRTLIMLSQVILKLGSLSTINPEQLENLFTKDLAYLKEFYNRINQQGRALIPTRCPQCSREFDVEMILSGESFATP